MSHGCKTRANRVAFTMSQEALAQSEENINNIQRLRDEALNHTRILILKSTGRKAKASYKAWENGGQEDPFGNQS